MTSKVPRLSSSIILLRRKAINTSKICDFEVLLAKRGSNMNSFSSFYVFPGGVTEPIHDKALANKLGSTSAENIAKITGIRELFEEAGVLLIENKEKTIDAKVHSLEISKKQKFQKLIHDDPSLFEKFLEDESVIPADEHLHFWTTFITPVIEKRRFETNFYVCVVDDKCSVQIDGGETVQYSWLEPKEALELNKIGKMQLIPPQYYILNQLSTFAKVNDLIQHASIKEKPLPIQPHPIGMDKDKRLILTYPGDEDHDNFPGDLGDRRRILCKLPLGTAGYIWINNLKEIPSYENYRKKPLSKL